MHQKLTKRQVWTARCECGESITVDANAPRERMCGCGKWVPYVEESWTGPEICEDRTRYEQRYATGPLAFGPPKKHG